MCRSLKTAALLGLLTALLTVQPAVAGERYGLGRAATPGEIAGWDIDVRPDGQGLPPGKGGVAEGETIFLERCAVCHGEFGEAVGRYPVLMGGEGSLASDDPVKTVGSYWPYATTLWDYIYRAMPFGEAQSLSHDETYAVTAFLLNLNDIVGEDAVLDQSTLAAIQMPNAKGFVEDSRPDTVSGEPCMTNCKASVEVTTRARILDVTPEQEGAAKGSTTKSEHPEERTALAAPTATPDHADRDSSLMGEGQKVFKKCKSCHQVGVNAKHRVGPHLNNLFGRVAGSADGFKYSKAMKARGTEGLAWDAESLATFLEAPRAYVPRTKMAFAGLRKQSDRDAIIAYLRGFGE